MRLRTSKLPDIAWDKYIQTSSIGQKSGLISLCKNPASKFSDAKLYGFHPSVIS